MFHNQQQQLPFSVDRPEQNFLSISLQNPPYVAQYQSQDPYLMGLVPTVSAATAMEIQNNASRNPARMFMFNLYSRNNFANSEFQNLVESVMDYIQLGLFKQAFRSPDEGMGPAVEAMVTMFCSNCLREFPGLDAYLDHQAINSARDSITHLDQTRTFITQMKQQMYGNMNNGFNQGNFNQPVQQNYNRNNFNTGGDNRFQRNNFTPVIQPSMNVGTSLFSNVNNPVQQNTPISSLNSRIDRYKDTPHPKQVIEQKQIIQPFTPRGNNMVDVKPVITSASIEVPVSKVKWKPTKDAPYFMAFNPLEYELFSIVDNNNNFQSSVLHKKVINIMDYEKHVINTVFGNVPKSVVVEKEHNAKNLSVAVKTMNESAYDSGTNPFIKEKLIVEQCLDLAWFNGSISRVEAGLPFLYRVHALVTIPFVSSVDETNIVDDFSVSTTYLELRRKMITAANKMNPELYAYINNKFTALVNRIIYQNLSIADLTIDKFTDDIEELINHLKDNYGKNIMEAFLSNQDGCISGELVIIDPTSADEITLGNFVDNLEDNDLKFTYVTSNYSLTYINCSSHELTVQLSNDSSTMINNISTPVLYDLIRGIIEDAESFERDYNRCLIRTNDMRVLECCRGALDGEALMLSLIK